MLYYLKSAFVQIDEPAGIIQNLSPFTLEVSTTDEENSGDLILPHKTHYFSDAPIFIRCIDGTAKTRVIASGVNPYDLSEMKFDSCCSGNILCHSCCGTDDEQAGGIDDEIIYYSDIAKLFSAKEDDENVSIESDGA